MELPEAPDVVLPEEGAFVTFKATVGMALVVIIDEDVLRNLFSQPTYMFTEMGKLYSDVIRKTKYLDLRPPLITCT